MNSKYQFAKELVKQAGDFLRSQIDKELIIKEKEGPTDLVTHLDCEVQDFITQAVKSYYPTDVILGEESKEHPPYDKGSVWIVDPIDGTTNFIAQGADFAILLAYFEDGVGKFGLIYDVMRDCLYHGGGDYPVYLNDTLLSKSKAKQLKTSLFGLNSGLYASNYHGLADLADQTLGTRSVGSAGIGFSHVLSGRLFAYASYLYPWDYAPAFILGEPLGYHLQTLDGNPPRFEGREHVILLPNELRKEIQGYLRECNYQKNL